VLGAYLVAFPFARVLTLIPPLLLFLPMVELPALVVLGSWFLMQLLNGTMSISHAAAGGVAWWAHIGGFVFGLVVGPRLMRSADRALHRWEPRRRRGGWMPGSAGSRRYRIRNPW
jgi:membrane associated rhomboid family serine protease